MGGAQLGQRQGELPLDVERRRRLSSTTPMRAWAKPRAEHMSVNRTSSERGTATTARPVDSLNSAVNGSIPSRSHTASSQIAGPDAVAQRRLGQRDGQAAVGQVVRGVDQAVAARR